MALSKLVIGLVAGVASVAAIGGITAGVVVSRNNTVVEATNENNESNSKETNRANSSPKKNESLTRPEHRNNLNDDKSSVVETKDSMPQKMPEAEEKSLEKNTESGAKENSDQTVINSAVTEQKDATHEREGIMEQHQNDRGEESGKVEVSSAPAQAEPGSESGSSTQVGDEASEVHKGGEVTEDEPQDL